MFLIVKDRERSGFTLLNLDTVIEIYEVGCKDGKFTRFRCIDDSNIDTDELYGIIQSKLSKYVI